MFVNPERWKPSAGISLEGTALEVVKSRKSMSVLAGPGAGKTELLAQRAAFLLNTGLCPPPKRILAIAFKVDAARNLHERVQQRSDQDTSRRFESLTLHAFAKRTLDQFREALEPSLRPSSDYKIIFPNRDSWLAFQSAHRGDYPELQGLNANQIARIVSGLPDAHGNDGSPDDVVRRLWWSECLTSVPSVLSFDMVMHLASHIVRSRPIIRDAIAATYTHVFLDEFQDVTADQYDLVRTIFLKSATVITAVGDTNQAIMGWAGARPGIFSKFANDFYAENRKLQFNFRSNARIVALINDLSSLFADEDPVPTESARSEEGYPSDAVEAWLFPTRDAEGQELARFVKESLSQNPALAAHDFVVLTRLRADNVETRLAPYFAEEGLRLRNDARMIGPISIQDLVKEPVFQFLSAILKMVHGVREGSPFQISRDMLVGLEGIDLSTDRGTARSLRLVQDLVADAGAFTREKHPADASFVEFTHIVLPDARREQFCRTYRDYQNREYLDSIIEASAAFFAECGDGTQTWRTFIENVAGHGAVKIMTIHKSKGLEYHTVVFTEFNDDAFWNNNDDVNVFFVALSRARERIRFSLTRDSRGHRNVEKFLKALIDSGVEFRERE
ncbi:UvrD-helicase domain-containing protein [Ochrobactrum sp. BTU1]|uniref:UvrD-helicase domain-containing protein n=1 Tax=Ochrobactrum sp. BTU1 TaxID=2840456 RepID=UPI001C055487|nr:ATP-dependent helicase [Ochrobactrum sp. BTU1]